MCFSSNLGRDLLFSGFVFYKILFGGPIGPEAEWSLAACQHRKCGMADARFSFSWACKINRQLYIQERYCGWKKSCISRWFVPVQPLDLPCFMLCTHSFQLQIQLFFANSYQLAMIGVSSAKGGSQQGWCFPRQFGYDMHSKPFTIYKCLLMGLSFHKGGDLLTYTLELIFQTTTVPRITSTWFWFSVHRIPCISPIFRTLQLAETNILVFINVH